MNYTKDQPGRYSEMLKEIAVIENTTSEKRITYPTIKAARSGSKSKWVKYSEMIFSFNHQEIYCIGVEMKEGVKILKFTQFEIPETDYNKPISTIVRKSLKDYNIKPKNVGSYKNCEGGGWYSMANLYELNGKFYTDAY